LPDLNDYIAHYRLEMGIILVRLGEISVVLLVKAARQG
jgi:hypothetical protein